MLSDLIVTARPRHWLKNLVCFAALVFANRLADPESIFKAADCFLAFCLASSAIYFFNDVCDKDRDRIHPVKRGRPIASGRLSARAGLLGTAALGLSSIALSYTLGTRFRVVLMTYVLLSLLYSLVLKRLVLVDVVTIAIGFVLRVQAGIEAIASPQSAWVVLCMFFMALFLGFGKRHGEITGLKGADGRDQRPVLPAYSIPYLNILLGVSATTALVCYSLYAVTVQVNETFLLTILPVTFGIARYLLLIVVRTGGEDPEEMLARDLPMVFAVLTWAVMCVVILYFRLHLFPHAGV